MVKAPRRVPKLKLVFDDSGNIPAAVYIGETSMEPLGKPAVTSIGLWGSLIAILPVLDHAYQFVIQNPAVLPPNVAPIVSAVGVLLSVIGRLRATKKITSLF